MVQLFDGRGLAVVGGPSTFLRLLIAAASCWPNTAPPIPFPLSTTGPETAGDWTVELGEVVELGRVVLVVVDCDGEVVGRDVVVGEVTAVALDAPQDARVMEIEQTANSSPPLISITSSSASPLIVSYRSVNRAASGSQVSATLKAYSTYSACLLHIVFFWRPLSCSNPLRCACYELGRDFEGRDGSTKFANVALFDIGARI